MNKWLKVAIWSCVVALTDIWVASYLMDIYPFGHWASFPIFITSMVIMIASAVVVVVSWVNRKD